MKEIIKILHLPAGTIVLSSIRLKGSLGYTTYQGGTTEQRFREYMEKQLMPSLEKDDVVIVDNMRAHHAKTVTELLDKDWYFLPVFPAIQSGFKTCWKNVVKNESHSQKEKNPCCF